MDGVRGSQRHLEVLDDAIADKQAQVRMVAYDLNVPDIVNPLEQLGARLKVIIDDSGTHDPATSSESQAATILAASAGSENVKRQHVGHLQHKKTIRGRRAKVQAAVCGSTNTSWRAFFVQSSNAVVVRGARTIRPFAADAGRKRDAGLPVPARRERRAEPFKSEQSGGGGVRMHHKFVVIDFDKASAPRLPRLLQLLEDRSYAERRKPRPDPQPQNRGVLRGRGPEHIRPLPGAPERCEEEEDEAPAGTAAAQSWRNRLVGRSTTPTPRTIRKRKLFA